MDNMLVDFPSPFRLFLLQILKEYDGRLDDVPGLFSKMTCIGDFESTEEAFCCPDFKVTTSPFDVLCVLTCGLASLLD
jgi:hypothetical protein